MSGGGRIGGDSGPDVGECSLLQFETRLSSPKANVVNSLTVGDLLEVRLNTAAGVVSVETFHKNMLAGSIASSRFFELRRCLTDGYQYVAEVRGINGGIVTVRIYPKG